MTTSSPPWSGCMKGRGRIETERFIAMRSHYGFESFYCQPGSRAPTKRVGSKARSAGSAGVNGPGAQGGLPGRTERAGGRRRRA